MRKSNRFIVRSIQPKTTPLQNLADLANSVYDLVLNVARTTQVALLQVNSNNDAITEISKQVTELTKPVASLQAQLSHSHSHSWSRRGNQYWSRSNSNNRDRSLSCKIRQQSL